MKCQSCGAEASGKFCSNCGGALKAGGGAASKAKKCPSCGSSQPPGSKFCTNCGKGQPGAGPGAGKGRRSGGGAGGSSTGEEAAPTTNATLAWSVAGVMLVVVMVVLGYPILSVGSGGAIPGGQGGAPPGMGSSGAAPVDLATMSLEQQGTVLFNRVMTSATAGDTADVAFFLPKALVIYEQLAPADPDGLYHYALLHLTGGDFESARAKAEEGLAETPDYLLLLAIMAEASVGLGETEAALEHYTHFLRVYDTEMGLLRPGYEHHQNIFPVYRQEAQAFVDQG